MYSSTLRFQNFLRLAYGQFSIQTQGYEIGTSRVRSGQVRSGQVMINYFEIASSTFWANFVFIPLKAAISVTLDAFICEIPLK